MKLPVSVTCSACGRDFPTHGESNEPLPATTCPKCGEKINIVDPLSISIIAERLLYRSRSENDSGDPTISIICSAMAVESALTQVYIKWKSIENFQANGNWGTEDARELWEEDYRQHTKPGGFIKSASFVSKLLVGKSFDSFVKEILNKNARESLTSLGFPLNTDQLTADYIQHELFRRRNRIMHWGEVSHTKQDATKAFDAALGAFAVLKAMDKERYETMEESFKKSLHQS